MPIKTHQDEIMIYCDPASATGKKVLAYAKTLTPHVREINYYKNPLTASQMRAMLKQLDLRPKDLMNRAHDYYQEHIQGRDFDSEGWLNILIKNPQLIKAPIAVRGQKVVMCDNYTNILQL